MTNTTIILAVVLFLAARLALRLAYRALIAYNNRPDEDLT